jgi:hypothetical protein
MSERILITKLVRDGDRADLYGKGHRWPDLKLFDLSDLADVGLDYAGLQPGAEVPCRFWAVYELSEKRNQAGNRYKDVIALEPMDAPATSTSTDNTALLAELRAIRALLQVWVEAQGLQAPEAEATELDRAFPRYGDGSTVGDNPAEVEAYHAHLEAVGQAPQDVAALRAWFLANRNGNGG